MSRNLLDLHPDLQEPAWDLRNDCEEQGIDIIFTCTLRGLTEQARLFRKGRNRYEIDKRIHLLTAVYNRPDMARIIQEVGPQYGRRVTNAAPGQSLHNYGLAFDVVPLRDGKCVWGTKGEDLEIWQRVGAIGEALGLEWAGSWERFREFPHFQMRHVDWRELIGGGNGV